MTDEEYLNSTIPQFVNSQLLAAALVLATDRLGENQIPFLENLIDSIRVQCDETIQETLAKLKPEGATDEMRNLIFASCADQVALMKQITIGLAKGGGNIPLNV